MTGRTVVYIGALLVLSACADQGVTRDRRREPITPRELARAHHLRALDHALSFDRAAFHDAMMESLRADPTYLPAFLDYVVRELPTANEAADLYTVAGQVNEPRLRRCLVSLIGMRTRGPFDFSTQPARDDSDGAICEAFLAYFSGARSRVEAAEADRQSTSALRRYPNSVFLLDQRFAALRKRESYDQIAEEARRLLGTDLHPLARLLVRGHYANALHHLGRDDAAVRTEREGWTIARRAGPAAVLSFSDFLALHGSRPTAGQPAAGWQAHVDSLTQEVALASLIAYSAAPRRLRLWRATYQAEGLLDRGELSRAEAQFTQLVPEVRALDDTALLAFLHMARGRARVKLGKHADAEADLLDARALAGERDLTTATQSEHNLLHLYESLGRDRDAAAAGLRFIGRANRGAGPSVRIVSYRDVGLFYRRRGRIAEATRAFRSMLAAIDRYDQDYQFAGEYHESIGALDRARSDYERTRDETDAHLALAGLTRIALAQQRIADARELARAYDRYMEEVGRPEAVPLLPGILARTGDLQGAAGTTDSARSRALRAGRVAGWAILTTDRAELALRQSDAHLAQAMADSASEAARRVGLTETEIRAGALAALAAARFARRRSDARLGTSIDRLKQYVARARAIGFPVVEQELQGWLGDALVLRGEIIPTLDAYARAATLADSVSASMQDERARAGYRATTVSISNRAIEAIVGVAPANAAQLFASWSIRRKAREVRGQVISSTEGEPLRRIRRQLARDRAIIDYVVLDSGVAALVITSDTAVMRWLPVPRTRLRTLLRRLRGQLDARVGSAVDLERTRFETAAAHELYVHLLGALEKDIRGRARLVIVPDAELHALPFDALALDVLGRSYVLDRFRISLVASLARLASGRPGAVAPARKVLAVSADNVPGAAEEIDAITRAFPAGTTAMSGASASESAVHERLAGATVAHFVVHAFPNDIDPEHAYLKLSPGPDEDGELHAFEISRWPLRGMLVVLSACATAVGPLFEAEGALSLARAFFAAGASDVVATLWPVSASAARVMSHFYGGLAEGLPAAEALHRAKLRVRGDPPTSSPFQWAGFQLFASAP